MSTITLQIPSSEVGWFEQMLRTRGWTFTRSNTPVVGVGIDDKHQKISPALRRRINAARKERSEGKTVICKTPQEMQQFFDSL